MTPNHLSSTKARANHMPPTSRSNNQVSIAVMGTTGSGKSTFINLASGSNLKASDHLKSCTQGIQEANIFNLDGRAVRLVDTPGFTDTDRNAADILKTIANHFENQYKAGNQLHGVIYIHRISDNRVSGGSAQALRLFRKICGDDYLKNTVIMTTMWDRVTEEEGRTREDELRTDPRFFKPALDQQAKLLRHDNTPESARAVIREVLANDPPIPLRIQVELVDEQKHIANTDAGKELESEAERLVNKFKQDIEQMKKELSETQVQANEEEITALTEELAESTARLYQIQNMLTELKAISRQKPRVGWKAFPGTLWRQVRSVVGKTRLAQVMGRSKK